MPCVIEFIGWHIRAIGAGYATFLYLIQCCSNLVKIIGRYDDTLAYSRDFV